MRAKNFIKLKRGCNFHWSKIPLTLNENDTSFDINIYGHFLVFVTIEVERILEVLWVVRFILAAEVWVHHLPKMVFDYFRPQCWSWCRERTFLCLWRMRQFLVAQHDCKSSSTSIFHVFLVNFYYYQPTRTIQTFWCSLIILRAWKRDWYYYMQGDTPTPIP